MALGDVQIASNYFMRRLAATRQGQQLSASMQFDLARSPLSDDELEDIVDQFRDSPRQREGWGLSSVLNEVLTREPKRIPVSDLKALQNNLIAGGYAPPDAVASGVWDPSWYAAFRRFDRDNLEEQRAGQHWYSAPVESGMRALANTLPSRVFQGIVGAAKGLVLQAPETAERVGLAGGALAGAGIGAAVGGPIGAAVGGVAGGAIGFFADLFGEDEGEEGQGLGGALLDALSPWDEYKDNPKAAWEDLGFVLTAASVASGVGVAARGVQTGLAGIRGAQLTEAAGARAIIGQSAVDLAPTTVGMQPGSWVKAALLPSKAVGQTELGAFGTVLRAAQRRLGFLPGTAEGTASWLARYSPIAFANRLGPKIALDVFGGVSQAQMGARLFGGIGQGTNVKFKEAKEALQATLGRDLTEEEEQQIERQTAGSTIEKAIATSPRLESGVEIPFLGDMVDLASFMFYPQKLLPFSGQKVAINAYKALGGADHTLLAYAHAIQKTDNVGIFTALKKARELVDPLENTRLRMEFGLHAESHLRVAAATKGGAYDMAFRRGGVQKARADAIREIRSELSRGGKGQSDTLRRVMAYSEADSTSFEAWLQELNSEGRGMDRILDNREATTEVRALERRINQEKGLVVRGEDGTPELVWAADTERVRKIKRARDLDIMTVQDRIGRLEKRADRLERYAERGAISPELSMTARNGARVHRYEIEQLKRTLKQLESANTKEFREGIRLAPARKDFQDRATITAKAEEFDRLRDSVLNAPTPAAKIVARQKMANYVTQLESEGLIGAKLVKTALTEKPGTAISVTLRRQAKSAAAVFKLPAEFERRLGIEGKLDQLGYKLVETGDDMIFPDQLDQMMDLVGVGQYSRRAAVMESIGLSLLKREDTSIAELMAVHKRAEVGEVLRAHDIRLSPAAAMNRLYDYLEATHDKGAVLGPLFKGKTGKLGLYKVDPRDLSVEQIFSAFEDVAGFTPEVAKDFYGALRRGSSLGGELSMRHPLDTARELGRAMRVNGAPGFSDLMRTWHAKVPDRLDRTRWMQHGTRYKPEAELARSPERKRFEVVIKETADRANVTEGQRNIAMALMDSVARSQVRAGRFETVDDFYRRLDTAFAEKYIPGDETQRYFKRVAEAPEFEELRFLAKTFSGEKDWYEKGAAALAKLPFYGKTVLGDGREIGDLELYTNILAAVSPRVTVAQSVELANAAFLSIKRGDEAWPAGILPAARGMLDDIARGHTIDRWGPARSVEGGKAKIAHGRQKVENFYQNLVGNLDRVTNDGWMAKLFGFDQITAKQYDEITLEVKRLADDLGWKPAQVQAALWGAVREENAAGLLREAVALEAKGDRAGAKILRDEARSSISMDSFDKFTPRIEQMLQDLNGYALLQKVEDRVQGMTQFGPDFETIMRFFRTADFATLAHENGHLLRRLLSDEDMQILERAYGLKTPAAVETPFKAVPVRVGKKFDTDGVEVFRRTHEGGGATWDPHTGKFVEGGQPGAGFAVAIGEGTAHLIRESDDAFNDAAEFTHELKKFARAHRDELSNPRNHIGTWKDEEGIHLDVSEIVPSRDEAIRLGALRRQKAAFDLEKFEDVPVFAGGAPWPREIEERFAYDVERHIISKTQPGYAHGVFDVLREATGALWGNMRGVAVETGAVPRAARKVMDKYFGDVYPIIPPSRKSRLAGDLRSKQVLGGAVVGGVAGGVEGDDPSDIWRGALIGASAGLVGRQALKRTYGYLPDALARMNTALRYTLSLTFDAGRYTEQNMLAMTKFNLPPMWSPVKHVKSRSWRSPFSAGAVSGDAAWRDAIRFWDELNGTTWFQNIDDLDRRMYQAGMLGFSPRNWEAAQAFQLYQRGWGADKIREAVTQIGRYGTGRTAAEKTANFVVFPFSFSKKLITTLGDFFLQAPGRNLLLQEGMRRYQESELDEKVSGFIDKKVPLLKELWTINNLAFGLSPGRFFLQGVADHRTGAGKAAQMLASFFVPSGAATSLAEAAGNAADFAVNGFVPIVITGESINRAGGIDGLEDVFRRYIPFVRELDQYFLGSDGEPGAFGRQLTAITEGADPYYQFQQYQDERRALKAEQEPFALAMGYSSVDGLLQSDLGAPIAAQMDLQEQQLAERYPSGFRMSQEFTNTDQLDAQALVDLSNKEARSAGEDHILEIAQHIQQQKYIGEIVGFDPQLTAMTTAQSVRALAAKYAGDRRFLELWDRFFLREYGPLRRVA